MMAARRRRRAGATGTPDALPRIMAASASASASAKLAKYRSKRDFRRTAEPRGEARAQAGHRFVIQQHAARRMHYDFRLELDGVLLSWSVPKGPSLSPRDRRLAVRTEDHPLDYADFEGVIPQGEYGGGTVVVWDRGTWQPQGDARDAMAKGKLTFALHGEKLRGRWHLVRTRCQRPCSFAPSSVNVSLPAASPARPSPSGSHVPRSHTDTVPPPY
ncbi:MAG TPA: DNA polymerase ligase N-terminal domain-containing protein, partial [Kofleriaceae bacterium]|nr:DNA polymerase ligase N-terminal domain-containing protein [Kofleriaceae bacterium]